MEFQENLSEGNLIQGYGHEGISVGNTRYEGSIIITAEVIEPCPDLAKVEQLELIHPRLLELKPDIVIIGTGEKSIFPHDKHLRIFLENKIPYEFMATDAACRTFNVLISESRNVLAVLLF